MRFLRLFTLAMSMLAAGYVSPAVAQNIPLDAYLRGGRIHYQGGRLDRAKEQFQKALDEYGGQVDKTALAEIYAWLGLSEAQLKDYGTAAGHFDQALAADTGIAAFFRQDEQREYWAWTALINAARQTFAQQSYDSSLTFALAALKVNPDKPGTYALIANSYNALGRYDDMLATAEQLLKLDSESPEGLSLVGLYYLDKPDSLWKGEIRATRWDSCAHYYGLAIDVYRKRFEEARNAVGERLKVADSAQVSRIAWALVEKSRAGDQQELKRYIEKDLGAARQLAEMAQLASQLFYAANNLNVSSSRAGSAMLRATAETKGDTATRFRSSAESFFASALVYDPSDYTAMFNLGIAQYQGQKDSTAQATFQRVVDGAVVPLSRLPADLQAKLTGMITEEAVKTGHLQLDPPTAATVDSVLSTQGYGAAGYGWFYFPKLRARSQPLPVLPDDAGDMLVSLQPPKALENVYLLLGVTQTGVGLSLVEAKQPAAANAKFEQAINSLLMVASLNPRNAEAYQNLVHCYRESGQKKKAEEAYKKYKELSQ